jgi:ABC-type transport system involved in cytochrome c biogenesis permease subunit
MPLVSAIPFYAAIVAYVVSGLLCLGYVRNGSDTNMQMAKRLAAIGNIFLLLVFLYRWWHFKLFPLTGLGDSLNLFLVLCTGIILLVQRDSRMRPLLTYYMPALAMIALLNGITGGKSLADPPMQLEGFLLTYFHIVMVFLAFSLFFVASLTSMAYVSKVGSLKNPARNSVAQKFPSLELLDKVLFNLIKAGYPIFAITLLLGYFLAWNQRDELGAQWYISPRIILALFMVIFYSASYHIRKRGLLRGPKLAYTVFFTSVFLFMAYLVIELMKWGGYGTGGAAS